MEKLNIEGLVRRAAQGARAVGLAEAKAKNTVLSALKQELESAELNILAANREDVAAAQAAGWSPHLIDRLTLTAKRLDDLAKAMEDVARLPDPVGHVEDLRRLENGLTVGRLRMPLGLIAFICEARPGALIEAAGLAVKSGNGIIVKSGKEMSRTAQALAKVLEISLLHAGLPESAVTVIPSLEREDLQELLAFDELIDLVIPRGGEGLIRFVSQHSRIPVLKHYKGVCHMYVDLGADHLMARDLAINAKTQRPSTCNSLETLLAHRGEAAAFLPFLAQALSEAGVTVKADPEAMKFMPAAQPAAPGDFGREFLDLTLAVKVVEDYDAALDHIAAHGTRHTEVIVTNDYARSLRFLRSVDASCVLVNASTRFNDGGSLGLGAEIGISTTKLHAYGPMGLKELTTTKFIVLGEGQIRS